MNARKRKRETIARNLRSLLEPGPRISSTTARRLLLGDWEAIAGDWAVVTHDFTKAAEKTQQERGLSPKNADKNDSQECARD